MLIAPSFFDGRFDGVGRVSGAFADAYAKVYGYAPHVLSSNDVSGSCLPHEGRCFYRNYWGMLMYAAVGRLPPKPSVVICNHLGLSPVARIIAFRLGVPYLVFIHGVEAWRVLRWRSAWGVKGARLLVANSEYTRRTFLKWNPSLGGIPSMISYLGVPVAGLDAASEVAARARCPRSLLIVARVSKGDHYKRFRAPSDLYKGFKTLVDAVALVAREFPDVKLTIVGDGDARAELQSWVESQPVSRHVYFAGRVSDQRLREHFQENEVFVLPSEGEGFGLVFVEAMALGLPCVAVAAGAAPEVVEDGVTGLVAKPRDPNDLATKIARLLRDDRLRERLGNGGRQRFLERFTYEKFRGRLEEVLRKATEPE